MTWRERIVAARERGSFTFEEVVLAGDWTTCAVGEQHAQLPHVVIYAPVAGVVPTDPRLQFLGADGQVGFSVRVFRNEMDAAESLLDQIEDRVLELKRGVV